MNTNDKIDIEIKKKKPKKSAFGILKGIGSFTEEDKAKGQLEEEDFY